MDEKQKKKEKEGDGVSVAQRRPDESAAFSLLNRADESGELTVHQVEDSVLAHVGASSIYGSG